MLAKATRGLEQATVVDGRRRHRAQENAARWTKIIDAQRRSTLTVVEFCRRRGIAKATFWYWRKRLVRMAESAAVAQPVQRFLAVPLVAPAAEHIEVDLGTMRVRLHGAAATRVVDALIVQVSRGAER